MWPSDAVKLGQEMKLLSISHYDDIRLKEKDKRKNFPSSYACE